MSDLDDGLIGLRMLVRANEDIDYFHSCALELPINSKETRSPAVSIFIFNIIII